MSIGYACLTLGAAGTELKSCIQKNADEQRLMALIEHNLNALGSIIEYNIANGIQLFRISSDLIPFGSHKAVNSLPWRELFADKLGAIGRRINEGGIRVSMHPGQYTVLGSSKADVTARALDDLDYHTQVLDCLGTNASSKIVLHIGGAYGDKHEAVKRFITHFNMLGASVRGRVVLENDDKIYNIGDVLETASMLGTPAVYDNLHNAVNPCGAHDDGYWVSVCNSTWSVSDGRQKVHYSEQDPAKRPGSHSRTVSIRRFLEFYESIKSEGPDIMLEVKDKNISALKCINCTSPMGIKALESEWARYKYSVLERSPSDYLALRVLLCDKSGYPALPFYETVEAALQKQPEAGGIIKSAQHVWGYVKGEASEHEQRRFTAIIDEVRSGGKTAEPLKSFLKSLAEKYNKTYLLNSYYFIL